MEKTSLSYQALNQQANQLAQLLIKQGAKPNGLIAFCLERSPELIISILAILKVGAAYVPIDPRYPEERIAYMKEDSQCQLFIDSHFFKKYKKALAASPITSPMTNVSASAPAYVIYTSGTTGPAPRECGA